MFACRLYRLRLTARLILTIGQLGYVMRMTCGCLGYAVASTQPCPPGWRLVRLLALMLGR